MIVLRSPKGWTCPREIDGKKCEDYWRSHQVPFGELATKPGHLALLEQWLRAIDPTSSSMRTARPVPRIRRARAVGRATARHDAARQRRPAAEGPAPARRARLRRRGPRPGADARRIDARAGRLFREVIRATTPSRNFRLVGPDETASNRLGDVFRTTPRRWMAAIEPDDTDLSRDGRVMEILSEHTCQGWLEGYLLTGRHGFFSCYEAFIHIVDSMFNQHAKWLESSSAVPWRKPVASLNYLLTSHVWRQDHNGFSHQDPGFIDHVVNKKAERDPCLPAARRQHAAVTWSTPACAAVHYVNVIVAGKQPQPQWLDLDAAVAPLQRRHRHLGVGEQRPGRRAGRGDGLRRRRADAGDAGRGADPARAPAPAAHPCRQRRRPDDAAAARGTSAWALGLGRSTVSSPPTSR